ncbi:MAG TPA: hypothetical protein VF988_14460 [Verrucomicrobiae bacterium]
MTICYLDDLLKLPSLIFTENPLASVFQQSTLNILLVLAVWLLVNGCTRRAVERIKYLERFMRVCAWCRRIHFKGEWMAIEDFMRQGLGVETRTTHGICPACLEQQQQAIEKAKQAKRLLRQSATKPQMERL